MREVEFDIFYDYGIDDVAANVDFLVASRWWKTEKQTILAEDLGLTAGRSKLIETIEGEQAEPELKKIVGKAWNEIEESIRMDRSRRFE